MSGKEEQPEVATESVELNQPDENETRAKDEPPPYNSLFTRVKSARQQSTGKADFVKQLLALFFGSVGCSICLGILLALPISMIVIGAIYLHDCPVQRFIPIYLIVAGCAAIIVNLSNLVQGICRQRQAGNDVEGQGSTGRRAGTGLFDGLFSCFMLAWFIAGNVWIYGTYGKFTTDPYVNATTTETPVLDAEAAMQYAMTYCHPTLYWFAFWITTAGYILAGVAFVVTCVGFCCCLCCLGRS